MAGEPEDISPSYVPPPEHRHEEERPQASAWADMLVLLLIAASLAVVITVGSQWAQPLTGGAKIDSSLTSLPRYCLYSLSRGLVAYVISLVFTIIYAKAAAASRRSERVMIPILDVLQSIPVLSFMPGLVLALVALFPKSRVGLELACVMAIFTGQVWNMVFSFHASLRAIPSEMIEVARLHGMSSLRRLFALEIPSGMTGLVWNSMMSMAGGWFFLTVVESFSIGERSFRVPGLGSFVAVAIEKGDVHAIVFAIIAMVLMIGALDQLLWRPVIVWAERFKNQETAASEKPTSWFYDILLRSRAAIWIETPAKPKARKAQASAAVRKKGRSIDWDHVIKIAARVAFDIIIVSIIAVIVWGGWHLFRLLRPLHWLDWLHVFHGLGLTFLRVIASVLAGVAWALPVGLLIGRSVRVAKIAQPIIQVLASFPAPMLFPLIAPAVRRVGVGDNAVAIVLMMLGTQWYILFNVVAGAVGVPQDLREVVSIFRTPRALRTLVLYIGGTFPFLVTGLVTAAGGAWNASIVSEVVSYAGGQIEVFGVGSIITTSLRDPPHNSMLAAATVSLSAALVLINRLVWKPMNRLATARFSLNR